MLAHLVPGGFLSKTTQGIKQFSQFSQFKDVT